MLDMSNLSVLSIQSELHYSYAVTVIDKELAKKDKYPEYVKVLSNRRKFDLDLSQEGLAARAGDLLKQVDVSRIETGLKHPVYDLSSAQLAAYIQALDWTVEEFESKTGLDVPIIRSFALVSPDTEQKRYIPVYDGVGAGPGFAYGDEVGLEEIPVNWMGDYRAFVVHGDSMAPDINDGDRIVVKIQGNANLGDIVVAFHPDHDLIVKRLIIETDKQARAIFASKNPNYGHILVCESCEIKGVVKRIIPKPIDLS